MFRLPSPAMCVAITALVVALGGAGYSATGGNFILGQANTASTQTRLTSPLAGTMLRLENTNAANGSTALGLVVKPGRTPFTVNSTVRVSNLNADLLDGLGANQLGRVAYAENKSAVWSEDGRTTLLTATLIAPQKGFVTLSGGSTAVYFAGCTFCTHHIRFRIDGTTDTSTAGTVIKDTGSEVYVPLHHSVTVPVNAGAHTYTLVGSWFDTNVTNVAPTTWYDSTLTAQFIPFNGSGTTAVPTAVSETRAGRPLVRRLSARSAMSAR